ncbi:MAG: ABC transporter substrate-binding protein [Muribaculum sp.]|nr:ABC transporter substrate-binding protein [Muribaculum sp.]
MKKKRLIAAICLFCVIVLFGGCGNTSNPLEPQSAQAELPDGIYLAEFQTDSSMFRVNETCDGKGTLTVENGQMTIHISLGSKKIVNLYPGLAKEAAQDGAELLDPTVDTVTYEDGLTEEVYGFDVPVPALEVEFDLALIGTKGKWYDHKVSVKNPVLQETQAEGAAVWADGVYSVELTFEGGSGRAAILSPVTVRIEDGKAIAAVRWNSPNYDYMIVDGEKYLPTNTEGDSTFEIPVLCFDEPMTVIGDTVAMSRPHEIEYMLTFHSDTMTDSRAVSDGGSLVYEKSMALQYAENFTADYYADGYVMLTTTMDGGRFLLVPQGRETPRDLEEDVVVLQRPLKDIYLVASSAMDMFRALDALDAIGFSGQKADGWYIEAAREAMERGDILYAGKYNQPDYELIVSKNCTLAIENRMISHAPEVVEKLGEFDIPVLIEYSSYEPHPLGRVEWVKFYGALLGKEAEAERIFTEQAAVLERVGADEKTDKTVAFFFVTSNGLIQVRQSSDYVPKMIELAGGKYVFENLGDPETKRSTVNLQVEEFYAGAKDADFLIYNSSIDGGVADLDELLDKCSPLADFKAVREGNVWCTTNDMYQQSLSAGDLIQDIHGMIQGEETDMRYLFRLE